MKIFGGLLLILGLLVLVGGVGYSIFLISDQQKPIANYSCSQMDRSRTEVEKAQEAYDAAKGSPRERELEKTLRQRLENEQAAVRGCSEGKAFYKTRITVGFLVGAGGFLLSLVGSGVFLLGRKRAAP